MYTSWAHHYVPKFNGCCAFLVNPLFIFCILKDNKLQLGNYRWLLLYFAIFNMACSLCDMLVPVCVHNYRYAFSVFTAGGPFQEYSEFNQFIIAFRCSFIAATYAILHAHFTYRFMVLFKNKALAKYFMPYGLILTVLYCILHMIYWVITCYVYIGADMERKLYMHDTIMDVYGVESTKLNMIVALYRSSLSHFFRPSIRISILRSHRHHFLCSNVPQAMQGIIVFQFSHKISS
ncbi:Serpentine receptor class gamma [Caenorhabditis elegans]|uniref:Serpentine receptor class gamma n=1 Tax=Caenorhabditis elegans TaxID=6239 RepID=O44610_CAEEL|nr:Serpentine receptor class gamma [Caenorhabditis elegans]CCD68883.1 Serpentine receptor class gamma [Caenorhabditis elegans]|eukprot:NP_001024072.1 Serpentine Receptor, class J [Caenorhabditis elegans]